MEIVHATPEMPPEFYGWSLADEFVQSSLDRAKTQVGTLRAEAGTEASVVVSSGDPPKVVVQSARDFNADLLVMGRHSGTGIAGYLHRHAYAVMRDSPCPRHQYLTLALCSAAIHGTLSHAAQPPDAAEIAQRAAVTIRTDWAAAPDYAFLQRDESRLNGKPTSKSHQVVMIAGSDYYVPVAIDDLPLPPARQKSELQKLKDEVARRSHEGPQAQQKRADTYRKQREQNGELVTEFPRAFNFVPTGEETIDGHKAFVLAATPRKRSGSISRAAKIFAGMRGQIWIDEESFQIISGRGECDGSRINLRHLCPRFAGHRNGTGDGACYEFGLAARRFSMTLVVSKLWFHST